MDRDKEIYQDRKNNHQNLKAAFYAIFIAAVFILELYLMINDSNDYILIGIVGLVLIVFVYLMVNLIYGIHMNKETQRAEEYESLFKSEKASYLLLRKNFDELTQKLDNLIENAKIPTEEMIQAQKAIAKVTINRNKENANAMLNSNDQLMEKMYSFDKRLNELHFEMGEHQKSVAEQSNREIMAKQQELSANLREMELSLKNELLKAINQINAQSQIKYVNPESIYRPNEEQKNPLPETVNDTMEETYDETYSETYDAIDEQNMEAESIAESEKESESIMATEIELEPEPVIEVEPEPVIELEPEPVIELEPEPVIEAEPEPVIEAEPIIEKPPMPDLSDPNKVMSPDEISALFANTVDVGESLEESMPEEALPVEEEKPPMPDLSNPNKVMTPEEIAALLANM